MSKKFRDYDSIRSDVELEMSMLSEMENEKINVLTNRLATNLRADKKYIRDFVYTSDTDIEKIADDIFPALQHYIEAAKRSPQITANKPRSTKNSSVNKSVSETPKQVVNTDAYEPTSVTDDLPYVSGNVGNQNV